MNTIINKNLSLEMIWSFKNSILPNNKFFAIFRDHFELSSIFGSKVYFPAEHYHLLSNFPQKNAQTKWNFIDQPELARTGSKTGF